jgi:hypothetical protein
MGRALAKRSGITTVDTALVLLYYCACAACRFIAYFGGCRDGDFGNSDIAAGTPVFRAERKDIASARIDDATAASLRLPASRPPGGGRHGAGEGTRTSII